MTRALRTSLFFSGMVILTVAVINYLASPGVFWSVYPILGVLWWPLSAYFAGQKQPLRFALGGTALTAAMVLFTCLAFTPGARLWIAYPLLALFWWPLSVWGAGAGARRFSVAGALYAIFTLAVINRLTSPAFWWWVYPAFFLLWWPLSVHLGKRAGTLRFALGSATAALLFLLLMHRVQTPHAMPWYLFAALPLYWWPVSKALSPRMSPARLVTLSVVVFSAYYTALTALLVTLSQLVSVFALAAAAWLVYAVGVSKYRDSAGFAALNAVLLAAYFLLMHRLLTPGAHAWYWYTFFPLLWWVYTAALGKKAFSTRALLHAALAALLYYGLLNRFLSPAVPWIVFLTGPAAVAVLCAALVPKKAYLALSVWVCAAVIAYCAAINALFTPHTVWAVYPAFAALWWPLSLWLHTQRKRGAEAL